MRALRAQSLVEFALIAPIVILLAMTAWDGGSVLREQVVLQQAARDGARVAATSYTPGASFAIVQDAVLASAADLSNLKNSPGYLSISYPDAQSVQVRVQYAHPLITPVLRQLWSGGQGTVMLSASATFYLPQLTPVPMTIVPSTPLPTSTPTPTVTPTPTLTPTATSTPAAVACNRSIAIPVLASNTGYYVTLQLTVPSTTTTTWTLSSSTGGRIELDVYTGNPFNGLPNPTATSPPANPLATASVNSNQSNSLSVATPSEPSGTYSVYFFKQGASLDQPSNGTISYSSGNCA